MFNARSAVPVQLSTISIITIGRGNVLSEAYRMSFWMLLMLAVTWSVADGRLCAVTVGHLQGHVTR